MGNTQIRVLMIDDDRVDRKSFERFVRTHALPYNLTCVCSVQEGRQALKTESFDVVVSDYNLGDGTAFDLLHEVPRSVPVVVVTGAGDEELAVQAMKAGAADYLIKDPDGNYLKILDVTVTHAMKARAAEQALREREEQFRLTFESARDAIFWADPDSALILRCNKAAEALLERSRGEIVGSTLMSLHPQQHADLAVDRLKEHIAREGRREYRVDMVSKSGRIIPVEISGSLTTVGGIAIMQAIVRDVTDRNRMERLLCQAQKMEALGTLAGGIAHDFNNILYAITGFAELALEDAVGNSLLESNLKQILDAANRAKDVVNQIRTFSCMGDHEKRLVSLGPFILETLPLLNSSMPSSVEVRPDVEPDLGTVFVDTSYIHQILMHLSSNAAHAMREKGGVLKVGATLITAGTDGDEIVPELSPGHYVKLTVSDTGHGMPPQVRERIFEPYFTTKPPGEGTGLGLAAILGMVTSEGGTITVESEPGRGTTFRVYLPVLDRPAECAVEALREEM